MNEQLVTTLAGRLAHVARRFVDEQRRNGEANDELARIERACRLLGEGRAGWSVSTLKTAMGRKAPAREDQLPHLSKLLRFCEVADVNAEWLFTGTGPERRSSLQDGATISQERLAAELAASLHKACEERYAFSTYGVEIDAEKLLELVRVEILERVADDASRYYEWVTGRRALATVGEAMRDHYGNRETADSEWAPGEVALLDTAYHLQVLQHRAPRFVTRAPIYPLPVSERGDIDVRPAAEASPA
ncbi:MAG: hypothetical protein IT355_20655 [Gemmatimonadaceae bacterium]|nr:hypothetical protein [Gemmatimonadaceae bacterium]